MAGGLCFDVTPLIEAVVTHGGHVRVGDYVIMGGLSAVQQRGRVGRYAFIGGMAGVVADVIPYGMAWGNLGPREAVELHWAVTMAGAYAVTGTPAAAAASSRFNAHKSRSSSTPEERTCSISARVIGWR
jgi:carbonic anhydrase/acetyltransferase-like protein (isoleucine patch superfamily)